MLIASKLSENNFIVNVSDVLQKVVQLLRSLVTSPRDLVILLCHWLLHAYAIVAFTQLNDPAFYLPFICLVPFPAIFYVLTVKFTEPSELDTVL